MRKVKTFTDLVFNPHAFSKEARHLPSPLREEYMEAKHAVMRFDNGYGISVVKGDMFYSNGIDTYEVAVLKDGAICYDTTTVQRNYPIGSVDLNRNHSSDVLV